MWPRTRLVAILLAVTAPALGATSSDRRCQEAVATSGRQILERSATALAACRRAVARGRLPVGTDCLADADVVRRRSEAAASASRRIGGACNDGLVVALHPGGDCDGVTTVAELTACLRATHEAEAERLVAVADPPRGPLSGAALRCATEASRQVRSFAIARLRLLQQCKHSRRLNELPPGTPCSGSPRLLKVGGGRRLQAGARIRRVCGGSPFGSPCDAASSVDELTECVLAAADVAGDGALRTEYPDPGFCGDGRDGVEQRIDALLAQMTLDEKLAQMHGTGFGPGIARTAKNDRLGIPGFAMVDGPRGVGVVAGNATAFPVGAARGATWDEALEAHVGEAVGAEARAKGASVILAPTINMLRHPFWGRAQETYGEDTFHLGRMGTAYVVGAQRHVIANPKHFALNSIENTRFNVDVSVDERTLREVYLPHFRETVQRGHAASVMSAYNKVNGQYCGQNVHLLHDVLKGDWGFEGFVESDWILGTRSTVPAVTAGLDIEMPSASYYGPPLADAVTAGQVPQAVIDAAVRRILRVQLCFRLDSDPPVIDPTQVESPEHLALARQVAREAIVLLKNAGGALPLGAGVQSIAVVGALAGVANLGDLGSSSVVPTQSVTPLAGIQARAGSATVTYLPSAPLSPSDQAVVAAADAVVVVAGLDHRDEGEGLITIGDRKSLALPRDQDALIASVAALNPRTVVVLEGSGAMLLPWLDDVGAVLMAWYPGVQGGNAIADVLFGDVAPSGKLPVTFPRVEADLPPFDSASLAVVYDYWHGYRYLDRNGVAPEFPFGFGLSYTTFRYDNLTVSPGTTSRFGRVRITADVTNTGTVAADEVAQLYVSAEGSAVDRAVRELKGFARVHLDPGATRTVAFDLRAADLAFWDVGAGRFSVEPIHYRVAVGSSSRDLPLEGSVTIAP
jgi:beta-glucosidase